MVVCNHIGGYLVFGSIVGSDYSSYCICPPGKEQTCNREWKHRHRAVCACRTRLFTLHVLTHPLSPPRAVRAAPCGERSGSYKVLCRKEDRCFDFSAKQSQPWYCSVGEITNPPYSKSSTSSPVVPRDVYIYTRQFVLLIGPMLTFLSSRHFCFDSFRICNTWVLLVGPMLSACNSRNFHFDSFRICNTWVLLVGPMLTYQNM